MDIHNHVAELMMGPFVVGEESFDPWWHVIVMQYIEDAEHFHHEKHANLLPKVRQLIAHMHASDFVHGDIRHLLFVFCFSFFFFLSSLHFRVSFPYFRGPNVLVKEESVVLIDFDWAGVAGEVKYPMDLNEVTWKKFETAGIKADVPITKAHDDALVEALVKA